MQFARWLVGVVAVAAVAGCGSPGAGTGAANTVSPFTSVELPGVVSPADLSTAPVPPRTAPVPAPPDATGPPVDLSIPRTTVARLPHRSRFPHRPNRPNLRTGTSGTHRSGRSAGLAELLFSRPSRSSAGQGHPRVVLRSWKRSCRAHRRSTRSKPLLPAEIAEFADDLQPIFRAPLRRSPTTETSSFQRWCGCSTSIIIRKLRPTSNLRKRARAVSTSDHPDDATSSAVSSSRRISRPAGPRSHECTLSGNVGTVPLS